MACKDSKLNLPLGGESPAPSRSAGQGASLLGAPRVLFPEPGQIAGKGSGLQGSLTQEELDEIYNQVMDDEQPRVGQKRKWEQRCFSRECDRCGKEAELRRTMTQNKNEGRKYFICSPCNNWLQWADEIQSPKCRCGLQTKSKISTRGKLHNRGKAFYGCPNYPNKKTDCKFFIWADGSEAFGPESQARHDMWAAKEGVEPIFGGIVNRMFGGGGSQNW